QAVGTSADVDDGASACDGNAGVVLGVLLVVALRCHAIQKPQIDGQPAQHLFTGIQDKALLMGPERPAFLNALHELTVSFCLVQRMAMGRQIPDKLECVVVTQVNPAKIPVAIVQKCPRRRLASGSGRMHGKLDDAARIQPANQYISTQQDIQMLSWQSDFFYPSGPGPVAHPESQQQGTDGPPHVSLHATLDVKHQVCQPDSRTYGGGGNGLKVRICLWSDQAPAFIPGWSGCMHANDNSRQKKGVLPPLLKPVMYLDGLLAREGGIGRAARQDGVDHLRLIARECVQECRDVVDLV